MRNIKSEDKDMLDSEILVILTGGQPEEIRKALATLKEYRPSSLEEAQSIINMLVPFFKSDDDYAKTLANSVFHSFKGPFPDLEYPRELMDSTALLRQTKEDIMGKGNLTRNNKFIITKNEPPEVSIPPNTIPERSSEKDLSPPNLDKDQSRRVQKANENPDPLTAAKIEDYPGAKSSISPFFPTNLTINVLKQKGLFVLVPFLFCILYFIFFYKTTEQLRKEARYELAKMSIEFSEKGLLEAFQRTDETTINLFYQAGLDPVSLWIKQTKRQNKFGAWKYYPFHRKFFPIHSPEPFERDKKLVNILFKPGVKALDEKINQIPFLIHFVYLRDCPEHVFEALSKCGISMNSTNYKDETALHILSGLPTYNDRELIQYFLKKGLKINRKNSDGQTPLHIAASCGKGGALMSQVIEKLLENGANPNLKDNLGNTPMHCAAQNKFWECLYENKEERLDIQLYHEAGVRMFSGSFDKGTECLRDEKIEKLTRIVEVLKKHGGKTNIKNNSGKVPYDLVPFDIEDSLSSVFR